VGVEIVLVVTIDVSGTSSVEVVVVEARLHAGGEGHLSLSAVTVSEELVEGLDVDLGLIWVDGDSLVAVENSANDEDGSDEEGGISPESGGGLGEVVTESDGSSDNGSGELGKHSVRQSKSDSSHF